MATKTFTFPASQVYLDSTGISHVITTSETFTTDMTDLGTTASYKPLVNNAIGCTDGYVFTIDGDPNYMFWCTADATPTDEAGCIQVLEGFAKKVLDVTLLDIDNADAPTTCTVTLQHRDNPALVMTWTALTVA